MKYAMLATGPLRLWILAASTLALSGMFWILWQGPWQKSAVIPSLLLTQRGWGLAQAQQFSQAADLLVPLIPLIAIAAGQRDLLRHRRAITAAWPTKSWRYSTRLAQYCVGPGLIWIFLAGMVPWWAGLPLKPWHLVGVLAPSMLFLTGVSYAFSEMFRHPMADLMIAAFWAFVSFVAKHLLVSVTVPYPGLVLDVATKYRSSAAWTNRAETLILALILWTLGSLIYHRHRQRGDDV